MSALTKIALAITAIATLALVSISFFLTAQQPDISEYETIPCGSPDGIFPGALADYYDECGPVFGYYHTPPDPRPPSSALLNRDADAPIRLYLTDGIHAYVVAPDGQTLYVCSTPTIDSIADWFTDDHGIFQYCGGYSSPTQHWYSISYWPPHDVMIVVVLRPGTPVNHYEPYALSIDRHHNVHFLRNTR